jgi:hypothetical protein
MRRAILPGPRIVSASTLLAVTLLVLVPQAVVFSTRVVTTVTRGAFDETTGTERVPIYGVWKARHGYPVYERPFADNFYPALYNFGFYHAYGAFARALRLDDGALVVAGRLLTCGFGFAGAFFSALALRELRRDSVAFPLWLAPATLAIWMSSAGVSWFYVTIRPDIASMACAIAGLWAYARASRSGTSWTLLPAGLLLAAAWCFKTSTVGVLAGICVHILFGAGVVPLTLAALGRALRSLLCVAGPPVIVALAALSIGGEEYRFNMLTLPAISGLNPPVFAFEQALRVFAPNPLIILIPALAFVFHKRADAPWRTPEAGLLIAITLTSLTVCTAALMRAGGYRNSLLEAYLALSLLAVHLLPRVARELRQSIISTTLVLVSAVITAAYPIAQLVVPGRLGTVTASTPQRYEEGQVIAAVLQTVPKPLYAEDFLFAEPWFSNEGRYPSLVVDPIVYVIARAAGLLTQDSLERAIGERRIPSLLLTGGVALEEAATRAGYHRVDMPSLDNWNVAVYVAPRAASADAAAPLSRLANR